MKADVAWDASRTVPELADLRRAALLRPPAAPSLGFAFPDSAKMDRQSHRSTILRASARASFGAETCTAPAQHRGLPEMLTEEHQPLVDKWIKATGSMPQ